MSSPCARRVAGPPPCSTDILCRAWFITWPVGLTVCVDLSTVAALGEGGGLGSTSPSKEKYPLDERRGNRNIDLLRNTSKPAGVLEAQGGDSGSLPWIERAAAPADGGSPPLPSAGLTWVEPSRRSGGLLDEQSGTVSRLQHRQLYIIIIITN